MSEGSTAPKETGSQRENNLVEKRVYSFRITGPILDEIRKVDVIFGGKTKQGLSELRKKKLSEEEIAVQLSSEDQKIHASSIMVAEKIVGLFRSPQRNIHEQTSEGERLLEQAEDRDLLSDLTDRESILRWAHFFSGMSLERLSVDQGVSQSTLENAKIELLKRAGERVSNLDIDNGSNQTVQ